MIFFANKSKDINKMSDTQKTALFKTLQIFLLDKGWWTTEWLTQNGITPPSLEDEGKANSENNYKLKEIQTEVDKVTSELEAKKQELVFLETKCKELSDKEKEIVQNITAKGKELHELNSPIQINTKELQTDLQNGIKLILETLSNKINIENRELIQVLDKVEDKLMRKETELQYFQEDSHLKATAPYLKQFIHLGDMIRKVIDENPATPEESASYLLEQFKRLTESIDFILNDFSVESYSHDKGNDVFDPHTQQAFEYPTDDIMLDKKIRRTLNPGYVWTLPYILKAKANGEAHPVKEYRMIFRREQVECFKYTDKKSN